MSSIIETIEKYDRIEVEEGTTEYDYALTFTGLLNDKEEHIHAIEFLTYVSPFLAKMLVKFAKHESMTQEEYEDSWRIVRAMQREY